MFLRDHFFDLIIFLLLVFFCKISFAHTHNINTPMHWDGRLVGYRTDVPQSMEDFDRQASVWCEISDGCRVITYEHPRPDGFPPRKYLGLDTLEKADPVDDCDTNPDQEVCREKDDSNNCPRSGNPIVYSNGVKYLNEIDFEGFNDLGSVPNRNYKYIPRDRAISYRNLWSFLPAKTQLDFSYNKSIYLSDSEYKVVKYQLNRNFIRLKNANKSYMIVFDKDYNVIEKDFDEFLFSVSNNEMMYSFPTYKIDWGGGNTDTFNYEGDLVRRDFINGDFFEVVYEDYLVGNDVYKNWVMTDQSGRDFSLLWDQGGDAIITDPTGNITKYDFDDNAYTLRVLWPDNTPNDFSDNDYREYIHKKAFDEYGIPLLTNGALLEVNDNGIPLLTYHYDSLTGYPVHFHKGNGKGSRDIAYELTGGKVDRATVTNEFGKNTIYIFSTYAGSKKVTAVEGVETIDCDSTNKSYTYDANGFKDIVTDSKGNITDYDHDNRGLEIQRIEAKNTPEQRVITTEWEAQWRLPKKITEPDRVTEFTYDADGQLLSRAVTTITP